MKIPRVHLGLLNLPGGKRHADPHLVTPGQRFCRSSVTASPKLGFNKKRDHKRCATAETPSSLTLAADPSPTTSFSVEIAKARGHELRTLITCVVGASRLPAQDNT